MKYVVLLLLSCVWQCANAQIIAPDTVCVGSTVAFDAEDTATNYTWNFSSLSVDQTPSALSDLYIHGGSPWYTCFNKDGANYYVFITDYAAQNVRRLSYGSVFPGTPTVTNLGSCGITTSLMSGIDVVKDPITNNWFGLVAASYQVSVLSFGASLSNAPSVTAYSTLIAQPGQVTLKRVDGNWVAFIGDHSTGIRRLDFGSTFTTAPTITSLPIAGGWISPCNFALYQQSGNWYMIVANDYTGQLTRFSFGSNLQNNSPGIALFVSPAGMLTNTHSINLLNDCEGNIIGYVMQQNGTMVKLDFAGSITNTPAFTNLGSTGASFVNSTAACAYGGSSFGFLVVSFNGYIRIFNALTLSAPASVKFYNPLQTHTFTTPGTVDVTLVCDMGHPSGQAVHCKSIVVVDTAIPIGGNVPLCPGDTLSLLNPVSGGTWSADPSSVATISSSGVVTGLAAGTVIISYVTDCGLSTAVVTVNVSVAPITGNLPLCQGDTLLLANAVAGGTWIVAPASVATISSSGVVTGVTGGTAIVSYTRGCGFETVIVTVTAAPGPVTGSVQMCPGGTLTLSNSLAGGTWSIAPVTVATISPTGLVSGLSGGTAIATYTTLCNSVTATVTVNPVSGPIAGNAPLCPGGTLTLSNSAAGGIWIITPLSVATVSTGGLVSAVSAGTATVSYLRPCGIVTAIITVNPLPGAITGSAPVCPGSTIALGNTVAGGTWSISPTSVATVSATGIVTGIATGTADVTYTTACGTMTATVTVNPLAGPITGTAPLCPGGMVALSNSLPGGVWSVAPTSVATIGTSGVVTGVAAGTAIVTYTTGCNTVTATVSVNTVPGAITGSVPVCPGSSITLSNPVSGGTWSISPTSVATVSATGIVTGIATGTADVTYTTLCGTVTATVSVNPMAGSITGTAPLCPSGTVALGNPVGGGTWSVTPASVATIGASGIVAGIAAGTAIVTYTTACNTVTATVTINAVPGAITGSVPICHGSTVALSNPMAGGTWSISPTSIATVSATGVVSGIATGTADVTYATVCGTVSVTVSVGALAGPVTGNVPVCAGSSLVLGNSVLGGTWSIAPASVATIGGTGIVTGVSAGTAIVSYVTACNTVTATVSVNPLPGSTTGIMPVCPGSTIALSNGTTGGTWSMSPVSVATITPAGVVTGIAAGTAGVTYTTVCGTATGIVTVSPLAGPITGNVPVCGGSATALGNSIPGGVWSIAPSSVASIGPSGIVTGILSGTAMVTYATGCNTVTATVTVGVTPAAISGIAPFCVGSTITLGNAVTGGTWSITPPSVATINVAGIVTGVSAGSAVVAYATTCGTVTATVTVSALAGPITGGSSPICPGTFMALHNATPGGMWGISPPSVGTISSTGTVLGLSGGIAYVIYVTSCNIVTKAITVNPVPGPITGIVPVCPGGVMPLGNTAAGGLWGIVPASVATVGSSGMVTALSPGSATVFYNTVCGTTTATMTVTAPPGPILGNAPMCAGNTLSLYNSLSVGTWSIAPTTVATISATGVVSGIAAGTASVTYATICGTVNATVTVNPLPAPITGNAPFCEGSTIALGNSLPGGIWSSASGGIAAVGTYGVVSGTSAGTAVVTYTTACGSVTAVVTVNPLPGPIGGMAALCTGGTIALTNPAPGGTWSIAPVSVATISGIGVVSGVYAGTSVVTYAVACGSVTATVMVATLPAPIVGNAPLCVGNTLALTNASPGGTWSASPASVATIGSSGVLTGVGAGTAMISYVTHCGAATTIVTVNSLPGSIVGNIPMCAGSGILLGNSVAGGTWSMTPATVASVSPTGHVTGISSGTATVSYVLGCGTATATVTVNGAPGPIGGNAPVCTGSTLLLSNAVPGTWAITPLTVAVINPATGLVSAIVAGTAAVSYTNVCGTATEVVTVNPLPGPITGNSPLCAGDTMTLSNSSPGGTWSCASPSTAVISASGLVNGVAAGTAIVWYTTVCGNVSAIVTVNPMPDTITGNSPICVGGTVALSNAVTGGIWVASPASVVSVSTGGVVTGLSAGSANVTYAIGVCRVITVASVNPNPVISGITFTDPWCGDASGTISLSGLNPSTPYTVQYNHPAPETVVVTSGGSGQVVVTGLNAGIYTNIKITSSAGCISAMAGPVTLTNTGIPEIPIASANAPCEGDTLKLSAYSTTAGVSYQWSGPVGFAATSASPSIFPAGPDRSGAYNVKAVLSGCMSAGVSVDVVVLPTPNPTGLLYAGPADCHSPDGWMAFEGLVPGATYTVSYLYNGVAATAILTADGAGTVRVTGLMGGSYTDVFITQAQGCVSNRLGPVELHFPANAIQIAHNNPCAGQTLSLEAVASLSGGSYLWAYPDGGGSALQNPERLNAAVTAAGIYTVTYTIGKCVYTTTTYISVHSMPVLVNVTPSTTIPYGGSIQLNAEGATNYSWAPDDGTLDNANISNPMARPRDSVTYTVYGTNAGGCADSAWVTIRIGGDEIVPTAFTPNGDGLNDVFRILNLGSLRLIDFSVYNRWGVRVYQNSGDKNAGWDGTINGVPADMGVYYFSVVVGLQNGTERVIKGDVTLIR